MCCSFRADLNSPPRVGCEPRDTECGMMATAHRKVMMSSLNNFSIKRSLATYGTFVTSNLSIMLTRRRTGAIKVLSASNCDAELGSWRTWFSFSKETEVRIWYVPRVPQWGPPTVKGAAIC